MSVRIILVDDHELVLEGLRCLLTASPHIEIVAECKDGQEAIRLAGTLAPDLVVVDVTMPGTNGVDVVREIRRRSPTIKFIALSMHDTPTVACDMLREGASGYLTKNSSIGELVRAVELVMKGQRFISKELAGGVRREFGVHGCQGADSSPVLTTRERDILRFVANSWNSREIAESLNIKVKTVVWHRQNIMNKLKVKGVADLTKYAVRMGLVPLWGRQRGTTVHEGRGRGGWGLASRSRRASMGENWAEPESNRRHKDFQSFALPAELSARWWIATVGENVHGGQANRVKSAKNARLDVANRVWTARIVH